MKTFEDEAREIVRNRVIAGLPDVEGDVAALTAAANRHAARVLRELKNAGKYAVRASYQPADYDGITNWPITALPMYLVSAEQLDAMLKELEQ